MSMSVCVSACLSVCLSVRSHNSKTARPHFTIFRMLHVAVAQSSSDDAAIRYVLPVVWMTLCFHTMGPIGRNSVLWYG